MNAEGTVDDENIENKKRATFLITNIVVNAIFGKEIDLNYIADRFRDVKFNPNEFPGIQIRISRPPCVVLLFKSGKMVLTGLKKTKNVEPVIKRVKDRLVEIGIEIEEMPQYEIVNIVVSIDYFHILNLDIATLQLSSSVYEPEVFPGIIFRAYEPIKCAYLIFSSGKVVLTGLKREKDIPKAVVYLGKILKEAHLLD